MKNIKKRLDYKNYIYVSASHIDNVKLKLRVIYLHLYNKRLTLEYVFNVPLYNEEYENFHSRLIYNLPKRKLLEIHRKEKEYGR